MGEEKKKKAAAAAAAKEKAKDESEEEKLPEQPVETYEDIGEEPAKATLTEEELKTVHKTHQYPDLNTVALGSSYASFTLPTADEGFQSVDFVWSKEAQALDHLATWMKKKKLTIRVEDLKPGEWSTKRKE